MLVLNKISKSFDTLEVIKDFTLEINEGEVICLLGPSGCGKSTLLKIISGLDSQYTGHIEGADDKVFSYVFQESRLLPWLSVKDNLKYVLEGKMPSGQIDQHIETFLKEVELFEFKDAFPNTLSGGMKQRVSLARAFSVPHDILLLDEPFQGLDADLKEQLMTLLEKLLKKDDKTVVMVTHDLNEAFRLGHKVIRLKGKPISSSEHIEESV